MAEILGEALEMNLGGGSIVVVPTAESPVSSVNGKQGDVVLKTSDLQNDSGYVTAAQSAAAAPVQSVNGETGNVFIHTRKTYPQLTAEQRQALRYLMAQYYGDTTSFPNDPNVVAGTRNRFKYEYEHNRNAFSDASKCWLAASGKYKLNCSTFVQMIMMGRAVSDFKADGSYSSAVTRAFDFGYYADFAMRQRVGGACKTLTPAVGTAADRIYYGFQQPNRDVDPSDYTESYSRNTYYTGSSLPYGQTFNSFMNANDLAYELWAKGCEIPFSELQIGDVVFEKQQGAYTDDESDFYHRDIFWRGIGHALMVYNITPTGQLVFMECVPDGNTIIKSGVSMTEMEDKTRGAQIMRNAVMCARLPIAWGIESNVPDTITALPAYEYPVFQEVT